MHPAFALTCICILATFGVVFVAAKTVDDEHTRLRGPLAMFFIGLACIMLAAGTGCAHAKLENPSQPPSAREVGPIVIRVRIVDTDPSDDVSLSFVYICSRVVELMRGEPVRVTVAKR